MPYPLTRLRVTLTKGTTTGPLIRRVYLDRTFGEVAAMIGAPGVTNLFDAVLRVLEDAGLESDVDAILTEDLPMQAIFRAV